MKDISKIKGLLIWLKKQDHNHSFSNYLLKMFNKSVKDINNIITYENCNSVKFQRFTTWYFFQDPQQLKDSYLVFIEDQRTDFKKGEKVIAEDGTKFEIGEYVSTNHNNKHCTILISSKMVQYPTKQVVRYSNRMLKKYTKIYEMDTN